jgi:hypothetical protein
MGSYHKLLHELKEADHERENKRKAEDRRRLVVRWAVFGFGGLACLGGLIGLMYYLTKPGGPATKFKTVPVSGRVLLDNHPLTKGVVMFHADTAKGNATQAIPEGEIDAEGRYELYTGKSQGAPPGWYRVTVFSEKPEEINRGVNGPTPLYNEKFERADRTELHVEVKESASQDAYTLHLTK